MSLLSESYSCTASRKCHRCFPTRHSSDLRVSGGSARKARSNFVPREIARASAIDSGERLDRDAQAGGSVETWSPLEHAPAEALDGTQDRPASGDRGAEMERQEHRSPAQDRGPSREEIPGRAHLVREELRERLARGGAGHVARAQPEALQVLERQEQASAPEIL